MSCTASGKHVFVRQAILAVLLEQIVDCPAKQVLHRYVEIHCQLPKFSARLLLTGWSMVRIRPGEPNKTNS
jgi:hypothetical protein